ncbi:hypothetical protein sos41_26680 [Alphaproteobacteria bacterium SO-S41]|nr:hypothetical protein sos41_26680 [Alphaproteobacteria bacterium SO-S41]
MTSASGETWFVPRVNTMGRRKGIAPVSRAGYLSFVAFVIGEIASMAAGFAVIFLMPDYFVLGIAIIVIGVAASMGFLFLMVARHTDYATTLPAYRAEQGRRG